MTGDRWQRVAGLFEEVVELPPSDRAVALEKRCAGDLELRREVERLLAADAAADDVLSPYTPLVAREGPTAARGDPLGLLGQEIAHYVVEAWLGAGGMGVVYRAHDRRLGRPVALKFLPPEYTRDRSARERLLREARAASAFDHPNICTIHEVGEAADGRLFIAMTFYEGQTLRERLSRGPLPLVEALELAAQAARGLAYAHRRGIIHRDVKPDNLLVTCEGVLKILDFGLARSELAARTEPHLLAGTAFYMAPEQAAGESVDAGTDLWSLGVVLHEMLTGVRPFRGEDPLAVLLAIRTLDPDPPSATRPEVLPALDVLVGRLLAREPGRRPASAQEVEAELQALLPVPAQTGSREHRRRGSAGTVSAQVRRRAAFAAGATLAVLTAATGGMWAADLLPTRSLQARGLVAEQERLLIADFGSATGDTILARAVTEALRVDLERSPAVRVVDRGYIVEVLSRMAREPATPLQGAVAREVALREGLKAYVEGDISSAGRGVVLAARLVAPGEERPLVAVREAARDSSEIIAAVDRLSRTLRRRLGEPLRSIRAGEPLERITTSSLAALQLYARATHAYHVRGEFTGARDLLLEAIRLDTTFAMAHRKLGAVGFTDQETRVYSIERAYAYRDRLPLVERLQVSGFYHGNLGYDPSEAFRAYRRLLEIEPENWIAAGNLASLYLSMGEAERAEPLYRGLDEKDAGAIKFTGLHQALLQQHRFAAADSAISLASEAFPEHMVVAGYRLDFLVHQGRHAEADSLTRFWDAKPMAPGQRTVFLWGIGYAEAMRGRAQRADKRFTESQPLALRVASEETWALALEMRARLATLIRGDPAAALHLLDAALTDRPLQARPRFDRPYRTLAIAYAEAGRPETAAQLLAAYEREIPHGLRGSPERRLLAGAYLALARGRAREAVDTLRLLVRLPARECPLCGGHPLGLAWERLGQPDSAIAAYSAFADYPVRRFEQENLALPSVLLRLGELLEARGDSTRALHYYERFLQLWLDADPELQPRVEAARRRAEGLRRTRS